MNYQKQYKKEKGFTVVELIVVISIFLIFLGISDQAFFTFGNRGGLSISTYNVVEAMRHAKSNAEQGQQDTRWGVYISQNQVTVFSSNSDYENRNTLLDQIISLSGGVTASGLQEVIFQKITGDTLDVGDIVLSLKDQNKTISINAKGTITH